AGTKKTAWTANYVDGAGKRRLKTFATRKAADDWLVTARGEIAQGTHTPARASVSVAKAGEDWIAQGQTDGLEPSTLRQYRKHLEVGVDIPTKDEIRAMLAAAEGWFRPLFVTAVFTGLRASELRGLRWLDVDPDGAELTVRQRADRWGTIGSPKSDAGKRSIPLAPMVVNALKEWSLACPKGAGLVFPTKRDKVRQLNTI